jgi:membrane carboxypeptidase/penicillin-binding protein
LAKQARIRGGNVRPKAVFTRRNVLLGLLATILAIVGYCAIVVVDARARTSDIAHSYYSSGSVKIKARDLSSRQLEILLKVEDPAFYTHHGVDFTTPGAGWTTITQALAKRFYFDDFQQGLMKVKQTLCAWLALDPLVSKERQLDLFMNIMYFGNDTYGLSDAARYYYGKAPGDLTDDEFISLIGSIVSPDELNAEDHPKENSERVGRIKKMLDGSYTPTGLFDIMYDKQ